MRSFTISWFYVFTVIIISTGSIPKGYDEGGFASASGLQSFLEDFGLVGGRWTNDPTRLAARRATITSLGVLGAAIGAGMLYVVGRLRTWQIFTMLWMTGFFTVAFSSGHTGLLLFARTWGGVGAGGLTVVAPLYLSEISRARNRGMIVSVYMVILLTTLMMGTKIAFIFIDLGVG
ncbi:hypothetical protein E4U43_001416 [Claviceps pusilla]|uniref:Major facilitator superfamily (MFS) profile domain-containing protein n=1 Tax=Claviceps pusilla TaxID=123648 RepID=A0A9P7N9U8_9HYPO|nr:hypothetical protein E4U43_001416 [Claviceps pusilla]